jgi:hypothetical protein
VSKEKINDEVSPEIEEDTYENFLQEFYQEMNLEDDKNIEEDDFLLETNKVLDPEQSFDFTQESTDMIKFIDWNERRHRVEAINYLKSYSSLAFYNLTTI